MDKKSTFLYTDEQLIGRFQAGDERAYVELVNRYKDRLLNFVFQFLGDIEQAEDVVQDTMLRLYEKKHYYKEIAKFSTWIYTIARNLANTELRKRKRRKTTYLSHMSKDERQYEIPAVQDNVDQSLHNEFIQDRIKSAISKLPEHYKMVIILRDIQELSYDDISNIVGVPLGTIKSRINRARLQLQADLQDLK
ncbi:MAG: sigma-70 family RNA polymerase sigma factor [Candidatus Marinimicrobia bacterium]|nr:sigma-70 family RNA polymerase sigma factor [Candidatus Neomarinimicrobiota bacterium]